MQGSPAPPSDIYVDKSVIIGSYKHKISSFHFSTLIQKMTKLTKIDTVLSTFKSPILRRLSLVFEKIDNVDKVRGKMKKY